MPENRARRVARLVLLVVGIACVGFYCEAWLYRTAFQLYENWQFDHRQAEQTPPPPPQKRVALPAVLPDPDRGAPRSKVDGPGGIVGRISIPRLNISAMVEEGVDETTLSRAVGHIPGTALPGETGNIGIAGHRDTFFQKLKDLQPNDQIDFTTHSGRYHYIVESLTIVEPSDVSVLRSTGGKILTIVTCFPFHYIGSAPRRFIVHAVSE
ncbi:MAG TPA: class D sortase [Bryobacteraceae bacterium]|jgi:sortase A|nr:class D sortase [Bryobacteraceae bacterium]